MVQTYSVCEKTVHLEQQKGQEMYADAVTPKHKH